MAADAVNADAAATPTSTRGGESWAALAAWAADEIGVKVAFDGKVYRIEEVAPAATTTASASDSGVRRSWFWRREKAGVAEVIPPFETSTPAELLDELVHRLNERPAPSHARPVNQPTAVNDLAAKLFAAYTLDGGQAHLAGCQFDDVPLVRLSWLPDENGGSQSIEHRYYDELGEPLNWPLAESLGLDRIAPFMGSAPRLDEARLQRMLASARHRASLKPGLETIVWAKRARGRLRFEFGDQSLDAPFEGWARLLESPAVVCPATGVKTFHLATVEGGSIAAAEQIGESVVTKRRQLLRDLVKCSATGSLAEAEHLGRCSASGKPVLKSKLANCDRCGLLVTPTAIRGGNCNACRETKRVDADDQRLRAILAKYPQLAKRKWSLAETPTAYVVESKGWLRRRVASFDKDTLAVAHAAEASRWSSVWRSIAIDSF